MRLQARPRILQIISTLEGGGGRNALELVQGFHDDPRFNVRLCVLGHRPAGLLAPDDESIVFLESPVHQRRTFWQRFSRLQRVLAEWQPSLIHSQLWPTALTAGLIAPRNMSHLVHIYDTPPSLQSRSWGGRFRRTLLRRICANPRVRLASVSEAAADYAADSLQIAPSRIRTIVNGIPLSKFLAVPPLQAHPERPYVIACAGRLIADKGFDQVLQAVAQISRPGHEVMVRIAGTGSGESALRDLSRRLGIANRVQLMGQVADMPEFLSGADVFVHAATAAEGMPRVVLESLAAGRPVVASDHAGAQEAIDHGTTGFVVQTGQMQALAACLETLRLDPLRRVAMGAVSRNHATTRFAVERVIAEVASLYTEMLI